MQAGPQGERGSSSRRSRDHEIVSKQLGREPEAAYLVAVRRRDGTPAVIENEPFLDDGQPMPTRYWLVDVALREAVSQLEAGGGVRLAEELVPEAEVADAHVRHAYERDRLVPPGHTGPVPTGGVGGTRRGIKCLHAHLAWHLAGGDDPVGRWTAQQLDVDPADFLREATSAQAVAAIDCGSNSTRLIVVGADGLVLERLMRITRLGEGVDATGALAPDAIERTLAVLREYRDTMNHHGVGHRRVAATSAVRDSENAEQFLAAAAAIVGVRPETLSGDEEGRLSFAGATAGLPASAARTGPVLVVDIGGGSTELAVGRSESVDDPPATRSLDLGCVRVSERFFRHDPPLVQELGEARQMVEKLVAEAASSLPPLTPDSLLVGLAGTVSTISCLEHGITEYDRARVHHSVLEREQVAGWLDVLSSESSAARLARPGMVPGREDVIVGGVLVLDVVMDVFGRSHCLVSEDDILDGLAKTLSA